MSESDWTLAHDGAPNKHDNSRPGESGWRFGRRRAERSKQLAAVTLELPMNSFEAFRHLGSDDGNVRFRMHPNISLVTKGNPDQ